MLWKKQVLSKSIKQPINNIKVTFELSFSAAKQLRDLAISRDDRLKNIGVLKVKINNGTEISLLDHEHFKKPTLPLFTSRKDAKGKTNVSGIKAIRSKLCDISRSKPKPGMGDTVLMEKTNCVNQDTPCVGGLIGAVSDLHCLPSGFEKKRVVLISQGTATDDSQQCPKFYVQNNENLPLDNCDNVNTSILEPGRNVSEEDSPCFAGVREKKECLVTEEGKVVKLKGNDCGGHLLPDLLLTTATMVRTEAESNCKKGLTTVDSQMDDTKVSNNTYRTDECDVNRKRSLELNKSDKNNVVMGIGDSEKMDCSGYERLKAKIPNDCCVSSGTKHKTEIAITRSTSSPEKPFYSQTESSSISTKNFQALQMLSDICVFETNMANHTVKESTAIPTDCRAHSVSCQTDINPDILSQNVDIEFIDESKVTVAIYEISIAPTVCSSGDKSAAATTSTSDLSKENTMEIIQDNEGCIDIKDQRPEECSSIVNDAKDCMQCKLGRSRSSTPFPCHKMKLRSQEETETLLNRHVVNKLLSKWDESMMVGDKINQKDFNTTPALDLNNNDPQYALVNNNDMSKLEVKPSSDNSGVVGIQFVPDNVITTTSVTDHNSSPLAMLKGTVSRIPTPDGPCHPRDANSPENIINKYSEILKTELGQQRLEGKESLSSPQNLEPPDVDDIDIQPPPLLYMEHGPLDSSAFQKTALLDTPPPLSECALAFMNCREKCTPTYNSRCKQLSYSADDKGATVTTASESMKDSDANFEESMGNELITSEDYTADDKIDHDDNLSLKSSVIRSPQSAGSFHTNNPHLDMPHCTTKVEVEVCSVNENERGSSSIGITDKYRQKTDVYRDSILSKCNELNSSKYLHRVEDSIKNPMTKVSSHSTNDKNSPIVKNANHIIRELVQNLVDLASSEGLSQRSTASVTSIQKKDARTDLNTVENLTKTANLKGPVNETSSQSFSENSSNTSNDVNVINDLVRNLVDLVSTKVMFDTSGVSATSNQKGLIGTAFECNAELLRSEVEEKSLKNDDVAKTVNFSNCSMKPSNIVYVKKSKPEEMCNINRENKCTPLSVVDTGETMLSDTVKERISAELKDVCMLQHAQNEINATEKNERKGAKYRKRAPDGTVVDDLSYVLKRIQGEVQERSSRKRKPLLTRSQRRQSDSQPGNLKRLRSSR